LKHFTAFLLLISLFTINSFADDRSNARNMGMSSSGMVSSFGIDAYGINPANFYSNKKLLFDISQFTSASQLKIKEKKTEKPYWSVSLLSVGGGYGCDSNIEFYQKYINYLAINRETFAKLFTDIDAVLRFRDSILPNERTDVNYDLELKWLSVNLTFPHFGALNFTISDKVGLNTDAYSRDEYMPLTFNVAIHNSNFYDITNVEMHQAEAVAWWIRKYNIGFSKVFQFKKGLIKNLSIGLSGGLVHGFGNLITYKSDLYINTYGISRNNNISHVDSVKGIQNFNAKSAITDFFTNYKDGAKSHFTFFPKPAGKGYSFDFGINIQFSDKLSIAASITELGRIKWDYNSFISYDNEEFYYKDFNVRTEDSTYNKLVNNLNGTETRDTKTPYYTEMPLKFRAGISYQPSDKLLFEFNWVKGNNNLPSNTTRHIISLGTEYIPANVIPLRAGISYGGPEEFRFSLGAGLRFRTFSIDVAASGINQIIRNNRIAFSVSSRLMF